MRTTDAVLLVVRCFQDDQVAHPSGAVDPLDDAETVELELVFADQAAVARRLERVAKTAKSGDKGVVAERKQLERLAAALEEGHPGALAGGGAAGGARPADRQAGAATSRTWTRRERRRGVRAASVRRRARIETIALNAKLEAEVAELDEGDRQAFLDDLGDRPAGARAGQPGRVRGARPDPVLHVRAEGDAGVDDPPRPERAGGGRKDPYRPGARIHPGRGDRVGPAGGSGRETEAKRRGWVRVEGRDYVVKDGDVLNIRFNV